MTALLTTVVLTAGLTACGSPLEQADEAALNMGNATPAPSPSQVDPEGTLYPFQNVRDLDATGDLIGVRTDNELFVGTLDQLVAGQVKPHSLPGECGDASANAGAFVVACGTNVRIFRANGEESFNTEAPVDAATITSSGEVVAGSGSERKVWVYKDNQLERTFSVARETAQIQAVPVDGQPDAVVRTSSFDTTIQDLDWRGGKQGGTLRAGLGVGKIAAGQDGLVLAADATGSQILVYTSDDIIRLHQMAPVEESPWDVAWDSRDRLAWITSTATNTATGYDISRGVPLERGRLRTVADAQSIASLADGTLVIASATGGGLQIIRASDKHLHELPEETM